MFAIVLTLSLDCGMSYVPALLLVAVPPYPILVMEVSRLEKKAKSSKRHAKTKARTESLRAKLQSRSRVNAITTIAFAYNMASTQVCNDGITILFWQFSVARASIST